MHVSLDRDLKLGRLCTYHLKGHNTQFIGHTGQFIAISWGLIAAPHSSWGKGSPDKRHIGHV